MNIRNGCQSCCSTASFSSFSPRKERKLICLFFHHLALQNTTPIHCKEVGRAGPCLLPWRNRKGHTVWLHQIEKWIDRQTGFFFFFCWEAPWIVGYGCDVCVSLGKFGAIFFQGFIFQKHHDISFNTFGATFDTTLLFIIRYGFHPHILE